MNEIPSFAVSAEQRAIHLRIAEERDRAIIQEGFNWNDIKDFRRYAAGKHPINLTERQREVLKNIDVRKLCDNVCRQIVSEANGRLNFTKWDCKNEEVKDWLDLFFTIRKLDDRQKDVHLRSLRDGNFVLSVNWDVDDRYPEVYKEDWWDGTSGVFVHYANNDKPDYAVKEWSYQKEAGVFVSRRVIWFPDRVERWEAFNSTDPNAWFPSPLADDLVNEEIVWPMPWLDDEGKPLGIPYIHFANSAATYGNYGVSELDGGILGWQDLLNDSQINMAITSRMTGGQQYWASGVKLKKRDGTSESIPIRVDAGMFHTSENPESKFGVLPAGSMDQQIAGYLLRLKRVAQISATPLHAITGGDWPSGDALLRAELPSVNKARTQIQSYRSAWTTLATMVLKIWNKYSPNEKIDYSIEKGIIATVFDDPEKRDAISRSIIVHNLAGNVSKKEALRIMDYTDERAEEIYDEILEENSEAADAVASMVVRGNVSGMGTKATNAEKDAGNKDASNSGGNNKAEARPS